MSIKKLVSFTMMAAALTFTSACGGGDDDDDGTGPNGGDELSTAEFSSMSEALTAIASLGIGLGFGFDQASNPVGLAAQTSTYSQTENCPNGGTVTATGTSSYTTSGNTSNFHYVLTQSLSNCRSTSSDNTTWTFNGNPDISITLDYALNSQTQAYTYTAHQTGGFSWSGKGKGGSCQTAIDWTLQSTTAGHYSLTYHGTTCGQTVDQSYTY